jgi:hypothetical protein
VKALFDNIKVEQSGTRAILSAVVPYDFFKKLLSETPAQVGPQTEAPPTPAPAPEKPARTPSKKK